jgi:hypothetical protein
MIMKKLLIFLNLCFVLIGASGLFGEESSASIEIPVQQKYYITQDQLQITENGIFVNIEGTSCFVAVHSLYCDADGLYIQAIREPSCGHGIYCNACGGCNQRCPYRCKCPPRRHR